MNRSWLLFKRVKMYTQLCKYALYDADGTVLCVILVSVLVNSTKFPIFCDTSHFICGFRSRKVAPVD